MSSHHPNGPDGTAPALSTSPAEAPPTAPMTLEGARWERRADLGVGGMGRVVLVRDRWLARDVAVKEPATPEDAHRLWREALVTAGLEHPGIVPVYDLGSSSEGRPWFAMRVVRGRSLAEVIAATPSPTERLRLVRPLLAACEAVAYAHARGVVHRDLKATNIMLGAFGESQVIDWGLAQAPDAPPTDPGAAGTPRAMSPEQARGEAVGPASDVWSLGVLLWEVVAGRPAFDQPSRQEVLDEVTAGRAPPVPEQAPRDLAAIIRRALAPAPVDRYADARGLADDLERWLDGRRVGAHAYTPMELVRRLVSAWRVPLGIAGLAAIAIVVAVVVAYRDVEAERGKAEGNLTLALVSEARRAARIDARAEAELTAGFALAHAAEAPLVDQASLAADARGVLLAVGGARPGREVLDTLDGVPLAVSGDGAVVLRRGESFALRAGGRDRWMVDHRIDAAVIADDGGVWTIARGRVERFAADGHALGTYDPGCAPSGLVALGARVVASGSTCATVLGGDAPFALPVACGAAYLGPLTAERVGERVRWAGVCGDGAVVAGDDARAGRYEAGLGRAPHGPMSSAIAFVGDRVLVGDAHGGVMIVALGAASTPQVAYPAAVGPVTRIVVATDGSRAAVLGELGAPRVVDLSGAGPPTSLGRWPARGIGALAFAPDGRLITAGRTLERWSLSAVSARGVGILGLAVSPDGARLAVAHGEALSLVDARARRVLATDRWQGDIIKALAFDRAGHLFAHAHGDKAIHVAAGATPRGVGLWRRVVPLGDGSVLVAAYSERLYRLRPDRDPEVAAALEALDLAAMDDRVAALDRDRGLWCATFEPAAPADHDVAVGSPGRDVRLSPFAPCGRDTRARAIVPRADGVLAAGEGAVIRWTDGHESGRWQAPGAALAVIAATPRLVAAGGRDGSLWIWRGDDPNAWAVLREHSVAIDAVAVDPTGRWLATGDWNGHLAFVALDPSLVDPADASAETAWGLDLADVFDPRSAGMAAPEE